jgi:hypothetical protein
MTLQAIGVIRIRLAHQRLVGIMASHAGNSRVAARTPAKTSFQAVRLEANARDPHVAWHEDSDVHWRAMTGAAEID